MRRSPDEARGVLEARLEPRLTIDLTFAARRPWIPRPAELRRWAAAALADAAVQFERRRRRGGAVAMSIRVVGLARSRSLNQRYRRKPAPTNVLSFAGAGAMPDGSFHAGELVICAAVVAREAARQGKRPAAHWAHLTVHGVLHLAGLDHERAAAARRMEAREIRILEKLGISDPYACADP